MFNKENLEKLLITNWTSFIDFRELINLVKTNITNSSLQYKSITQKKTNIQLSRFFPTKEGFEIWVEFMSPEYMTTSEFMLTLDGKIKHIQTIGFVCKDSYNTSQIQPN